jgi:hypothetical protein
VNPDEIPDISAWAMFANFDASGLEDFPSTHGAGP